ncbi:hypothetical protein CKO11_01240 [Rhodobacter sp. TJ_12]|uniref:SH3 domain-containing protein n=1 Tax=Rhodobacter sp. TJ_12 TaxID=2029399 RepID=UPI001CBE93A8|nr:SH3 domain-containing protein [Rhodobacter sp. TJ_12]MBZ4021087.1 hypothetical protein [Rhodobacter sp. TJ_12]
MIRMTFLTLVALYLVLTIVGRSVETDGLALAPSKVAAAEPPKTSLLAKADAALMQDDMLVQAAVRTTQDQAPRIVPARLAPMPGPALRPSPEYRVKDDIMTAGPGRVFAVRVNRANVRGGRGTTHPVIGSLERGEEVRVVADPGDGWVQVRIEGDGVDGWMAKSLLRPNS